MASFKKLTTLYGPYFFKISVITTTGCLPKVLSPAYEKFRTSMTHITSNTVHMRAGLLMNKWRKNHLDINYTKNIMRFRGVIKVEFANGEWVATLEKLDIRVIKRRKGQYKVKVKGVTQYGIGVKTFAENLCNEMNSSTDRPPNLYTKTLHYKGV
jgi:hypothetical protein